MTLTAEQIAAFRSKMAPIYEEWAPLVGRDLMASVSND